MQDGTEVAGQRSGKRHVPLMLLSGLMTDVRIWGAQIESLSAQYPLYLAHTGEADSVEGMAEAVLDGAPPVFALAGHGLGGMVAIEMMRRAPERIDRIALFCTNCLAETPPMAAERALRIARAKAGRLADAMAEEVPESALAPGEYRPMIAGFLAEMALEMGEAHYLRQARALQRRPDQQRTLRQIKVPTLICCGEHDTLYLPRRHEFMAGLVPRAKLVVIEGAGHLPMVEQPGAVTKALAQWMDSALAPSLLRNGAKGTRP